MNQTTKLVYQVLLLLALTLSSGRLPAQEEIEIQLTPEEQRQLEIFQSLTWIQGPAEINVGRYGVIKIGANQVGLNQEDARKYVAALGNPPGKQLALVAAADESEWFVDFEFDDVGYVEDDEKDDIDADELLDALRTNQEEANKQRKDLGLDTLDLRGWSQSPRYDDRLKALTWAIHLRSPDGGNTVNHNIRLLGRRGVMIATLICSPESYPTAKTEAVNIVGAFKFKGGERYDDFTKGDKIAEYGLKGLILGGGLAVALKTGLLQKFWKLIVIAVLAVVGVVKKMLGIKSKPKKSRRSGSRVRRNESDEIIE